MANKDNREVLQSVRTLVDENNRKARVLGEDDLEEIAGMYSQEELDRFVQEGILAGDWKSAKTEKATGDDDDGEPKDKPLSKMTKAELVAEAERLGVSVTPDSMNMKQIVEAIEGATKE